jgi:hypothetical protein
MLSLARLPKPEDQPPVQVRAGFLVWRGPRTFHKCGVVIWANDLANLTDGII